MENLDIQEKFGIDDIVSNFDFDDLPTLDNDLIQFQKILTVLTKDKFIDKNQGEVLVDQFVLEQAQKLDGLLRNYEKGIDKDSSKVKQFLFRLKNKSILSNQLQEISSQGLVKDSILTVGLRKNSLWNTITKYFDKSKNVPIKSENLNIEQKFGINDIVSNYNFDDFPNLDNDLKIFTKVIDDLVDLGTIDFSGDIDMKEELVDEYVLEQGKQLNQLLSDYDKGIDEDGGKVKEFIAGLKDKSTQLKQLKIIASQESKKDNRLSVGLGNLEIQKKSGIDEIVTGYDFDDLPTLDNDLKNYKNLLDDLVKLGIIDFFGDIEMKEELVDKYVLKQGKQLNKLLDNYDKGVDKDGVKVKEFLAGLKDKSKQSTKLKKIAGGLENLEVKEQFGINEITSDYDFDDLPDLDNDLKVFKKLLDSLVDLGMLTLDFKGDIKLKGRLVDNYVLRQAKKLDKLLQNYDEGLDKDGEKVKEFLAGLKDKSKQLQNLKKIASKSYR